MNLSVEVHHRAGKLSTAETLLTEVQRKVCNVCNQGKTLCSPCNIGHCEKESSYKLVSNSNWLPRQNCLNLQT